MSSDQQFDSREPSGSGSGIAEARDTVPVALPFMSQGEDGVQRFWPPALETSPPLDGRHEGERWALEMLRHYRDSQRLAAPLLRRVLNDASISGSFDAPHLDGFIRVIDDVLRLSARSVHVEEYGQALALQQQSEQENQQRDGASGQD
jgi:hypothetical protein